MKRQTQASQSWLTIICSGLLLGAVQGGELITPAPEPKNNGDWCDWLSSKPGTLYKNSDNPFIQEFQVFGRFQWQAAYLMGEDTTGYDYSDDYTEVRRFRLGGQMKFLEYFTLKANVNLVNDARHGVTRWPGNDALGWGYEDFDEATLSFNAKKAFNIESLDELTLKYGRLRYDFSYEGTTSSKKLLTIERSAIANKVYGSYRPTGFTVNAVKGPWDFTASLLSTDAATLVGGNVDFLGEWNEGLAYYIGVSYQPTDSWFFDFDFIYNDAEFSRGEDNLFGYEWATSLSAAYEADSWGIILNGIYGDNGSGRLGNFAPARQGDFWGVVVMPYYWIVDDKLQSVVRYQYQGSQNTRGIRVNSRYMRRDHGTPVNLRTAGSRGNEHHSIYAGLNYLICGHNLKVQAGVEYDWLNIPGAGTTGDSSALTYWFGFRSYF